MKHSTLRRVFLAPLGVTLCASVVTVGLASTASAAKPGGGGGGGTTSSVDAKINGSDGPITVPNGTVAYFSWTSQNVDSCSVVVKIGDMTIHEGSVPLSATDIATPPVQFPLSYSFTCTKRRTKVTDSVAVSSVADPSAFAAPQPVTIEGYNGIAMEPFLLRSSPDGQPQYLFFNNSNDPSADTNIYYATRVDDTTFTYVGELPGVNNLDPEKPTSLEAGPTMDDQNQFYYTNLKDYDETFISTFVGILGADGTVTDVQPVDGLAPGIMQWVTMDTGVSPDGNTMYYANAYFDPNSPPGSPPTEVTMYVAAKTGHATFSKLSNSDTLLAKVNGDNGELNYAANISSDGLELFFTRTSPGAAPQMYVARRTSTTESFSTIQLIVAADGFVEGPTLSDDGKRLYYHKAIDPVNDPGNFKIYMVTRP